MEAAAPGVRERALQVEDMVLGLRLIIHTVKAVHPLSFRPGARPPAGPGRDTRLALGLGGVVAVGLGPHGGPGEDGALPLLGGHPEVQGS